MNRFTSWLFWRLMREGMTFEQWEMRGGKWVHMRVSIGRQKQPTRKQSAVES